MEKRGILKCVVTQNVDGLHQKAGSKRVIEYHGGLNKFRCVKCNSRFTKEDLDLERLTRDDKLPPCCPCGGVIKDDGVFFGEPIPTDVLEKSQREALKCDLMLICGTSAVVTPFAYLPRIASGRRSESGSVTIIEVNAERTPLTAEKVSDYLIQGKTGEILPKILEQMKGS
jgi:NAD-dependent deacetylase